MTRIPADKFLLEDARDICRMLTGIPFRAYPPKKWVTNLIAEDSIAGMRGLM